ncbi:hypothetical protein OsJ_30237 [Oryza sativa Japonica Group]|uniref:Uncharacterized protein n=1 Tax=Oryza sativa subsp. japonica TaxID=39947 RepID=Q69NI9_ORYSJ|nr:hypothetical protein OsJ_30237 [Oryza sativa Japonica Group]BAD33738.1 hypothetical protein [Oryza sativa Japonica Group]
MEGSPVILVSHVAQPPPMLTGAHLLLLPAAALRPPPPFPVSLLLPPYLRPIPTMEACLLPPPPFPPSLRLPVYLGGPSLTPCTASEVHLPPLWSSPSDRWSPHIGTPGSHIGAVQAPASSLSSCSETAVSFLPAPALPTSMESTFPSPRPPSTPSSSTPPSSPVPPPSARSPTVPAPADADDDDQGGGSGQEAGGGNGEDEAGGGDDSNGHGDEQDGDYSSDVQRRDVPRHESADGSEIHDEHHVIITGEEPPVSPVPREPPVAHVRNRRPISLLCAVPMFFLYGAYHFTIGGSAFGIDKHVTHDRLMAGGILAGIWLFLLPFLILGHVYFSHRIRVRVLRNNAPSAGEAQVPATDVQDEGYFPRKIKASVSLMVLRASTMCI